MARRRCRIACSGSRKTIERARCRGPACSTRWTSSASAASRSRCTPSRCRYRAKDGQTYALNLIDTPGHVDFSSEVSRSLAACEGALLVIDAAQGVEAQTLANYHLALEHDLTIIPVINKIDLPSADPERVKREIEDMLVIDGDDAILASAKEGIGIEEILEAIVTRIPPPKGRTTACAGWCSTRSSIRIAASSATCASSTARCVRASASCRWRTSALRVREVGVFKPEMRKTTALEVGNVGYVIANIKFARRHRRRRHDHRVGQPGTAPLRGYSRSCRWSSAGCIRTRALRTPNCATRSRSCKLNDAALASSRRARSRSASASAAASSACCTWRSSRSGSSATTTSDLIATSPSVVFRVTRPTAPSS